MSNKSTTLLSNRQKSGEENEKVRERKRAAIYDSDDSDDHEGADITPCGRPPKAHSSVQQEHSEPVSDRDEEEKDEPMPEPKISAQRQRYLDRYARNGETPPPELIKMPTTVPKMKMQKTKGPFSARHQSFQAKRLEARRLNRERKEATRQIYCQNVKNNYEAIREATRKREPPTPAEFTITLRERKVKEVEEGDEEEQEEDEDVEEKRKVKPLDKLPSRYRGDRNRKKQIRPLKPRTKPVPNTGVEAIEALRVLKEIPGNGWHKWPRKIQIDYVDEDPDPEDRIVPKARIEKLEKAFEETPYLRKSQKMVLAKQCDLAPKQVSSWFTNRRRKEKLLASRDKKNLPKQMVQMYEMIQVKRDLGHDQGMIDEDEGLDEAEDEPVFEEDEEMEVDTDSDEQEVEEVEEEEEDEVVTEVGKKTQIYWGDDDSDDDDSEPLPRDQVDGSNPSRRAPNPF